MTTTTSRKSAERFGARQRLPWLRTLLALLGGRVKDPGAAASAAPPAARRTPLRPLWSILPPVLLLAAWLAGHPWHGVWHDAMLYTVQALARLQPDAFRHDLYFLYGSQDSFTLFSPLYARAIAALGVEDGALLMVAAGHALWLAGAAWLLAGVLRGAPFWLGMALLCVMPLEYGPMHGMLNLAETFPTPRVYAEACSMLALGCAVRGQAWRTAAALLPALALHPLMALGAAGLLLCYAAPLRPRLAAAAVLAGLLLFAACAWLGLAPFNRIVQAMDGDWYSRVVRTAALVAWNAWPTADWLGRTAFAFSLLLAAALLGEGAARRLFLGAALAGGLGLLATWLGTGVVHNVFIMQIQPWRVLWLVQLLSWVALAWIAARCRPGVPAPRFASPWWPGRTGCLLLLALPAACALRETAGALLVAMVCAACLVLRRRAAPPLTTFGFGLLAAALVLAPLPRYLELAGRAAATVAPPPGSGQPWPLFHDRETAAQVRAAFLPLIPRDATVYWADGVGMSWFVLNRASYASRTQIAGLVFNRGTAIEGYRRLERVRGLGGADAMPDWDPAEQQRQQSLLSRPGTGALRHACGDPALGFVVLAARLTEEGKGQPGSVALPAAGNAAVPAAGQAAGQGAGPVTQVRAGPWRRALYLYDCAQWRGAATAPPSAP